MTAEECVHGVFPAIKWEAEEHYKIKEPVYSYDRATPHVAAAPFFGWQEGTAKCAPLCAKSPDMHKVPEHNIREVKRCFMNAAIAAGTHTLTPQKAQRLLVEVFEREITAEKVAGDAAGLPLTMRVIAANKGAHVPGKEGKDYLGTGGDWAPKVLR